MLSSFKIGKVFGIEIGVHWSWIFIFGLITYSFADKAGILHQYIPEWSAERRWIVSGIIALIFFSSILLHELSHSLVAKAKGIPVRGITLFVFGGVSNLGREAESAAEEFQIAIVGPLTSLAIGAVFAMLWAGLRNPAPNASAIAGYLAFINGMLAAFNMLPGYPLDGGRVFRSLVWARNRNQLRATRVAARTGEGVAYLLMAAGAVVFFFAPISGIWFFLIGLFLRNASASSYEQLLLQTTLEGVSVMELARSDYTPVSPDMTVDVLVDGHMLAGHGRAYPVLAGQELLGLITLTDVRKLERERWPETSVYRAMTPIERLHTVSRTETAMHVLQLMAQWDVNQVPVLDGRLLVGIISRGDILRHIQMRREVGVQG
jgi:Zn-dependent protease/CBS domain-containing protein